jgi:cysteine desulfuration protein SufE
MFENNFDSFLIRGGNRLQKSKFLELCSLKIKTMTIEQVQNEIIDEFSVFTDWMDKYGYLIELGNDLQNLDPKEKIDQNLIKGCQSRVWLVAEIENGKIIFRGESDAVIVKGLVALLLRVVSGRTPQEIIESDLHFIDDLGLKQHLSPTRSNGLLAMVKQIRLYAVAYNKIAG